MFIKSKSLVHQGQRRPRVTLRSAFPLALLALLILSVSMMGTLMRPAWAQAEVKGIAVSPALQQIKLTPGAPSTTFSYAVTNTSSATANLRLSMLDFGSLNESGGVAFVGRGAQETTSYGLKQWVVLGPDTLTLQPGETRELSATVTDSKDLPSGGHYGAIVVTSEQVAPDGESLAILPSTSVLVLLTKTDGQQLKLALKSTTAKHSPFKLPDSASVRFGNEGNTHLVPRGTVKLQDPRHRIIARGIINEESGFVLPDSNRVFNVPLKSFSKGWLPGRYNIITTWRYEGQETSTTTVTHVWYIGLIPIILLTVVLFIICLIFVQRRFIRKNTKK